MVLCLNSVHLVHKKVKFLKELPTSIFFKKKLLE